MKSLLIKAIVCCAALLPITQAQASGPAGKNFYDLKPGTKYTLTCSDVVATVAGLDGRAKQIKLPIAGIPTFTKNKAYKFKIGGKGELIGSGFSTAFKTAAQGTTVYVDKKSGNKLPDTAAVKTDLTTKKAIYTQLAFHKVTGSGFGTKVYFVVYLFD